MKFGKILGQLADSDVTYGFQVIQYKLLKQYLCNHDYQEATFIQLVENEHKRIKNIIEAKLSDQRLACDSLVANVEILVTSNKKELELREACLKLEKLTDDQATSLASLERFVYYNMEGFRKIIKKHDKLMQSSLQWIELIRLRASFIKTGSEIEALLLDLSDIYQFLLENDPERKVTAEHNVSDSTFERKSHKYWVATKDVFQLKTKLIKHLPVHIYNRRSKRINLDESRNKLDVILESDNRDKEDENRVKMGWISSVYYDSNELSCYKERVERSEGATLFRTRWYGNAEEAKQSGFLVISKPSDILFMERKTHHEKWYNENSLKERFNIRKNEIEAFLKGSMKVESLDIDEKSRDLAAAVQKEFLDRKLVARVRTVYKRSAFQMESTNDVRITLDTNLSFVDERPHEFTTGQWRRAEQQIETQCDWVSFPYAVLEVKLREQAPAWLENVLDQPGIRQVNKFSKFQQGCATFYTKKIKAFPYWLSKEEIQEMIEKSEKHASQAISPYRKDSVLSNSNSDTIKPELAARRASKSLSFSNGSSYVNHAFSDSVNDVSVESKVAIQSVQVPNNDQEPKQLFRSPDYVVLNVESSQPKDKVSKKGPRFTPFKKFRQRRREKKGPKIASGRVKVEPKTYFANERTFLQWIRSGVNLFTMGGALYNLGTIRAAEISGLVFMSVSTIIIVYAVGLFYWRRYKINHRSTGSYDDVIGPLVLAFLIMAVFVTTLTLNQIYGKSTN